MKIKYKGQEIEAYPLIMKRENALAILQGKKTIETRKLSAKYERMFTDYEQLDENEKLRKEGRDEECKSILRTDIEAIHFYSTGAPWTLDVLIDEIGISEITEEGLEFMHKEFNFHEFDEAYEEHQEEFEAEIPLYYYLHICEVLGHKGLE